MWVFCKEYLHIKTNRISEIELYWEDESDHILSTHM